MRYTLSYARTHRPRAVLLENVVGLAHRHRKTLRKIVRFLEEIGYKVKHTILNSSDFGIPHDRRRLILVAIRSDSLKREFKWPVPTTRRSAKSLLDPPCAEDSPFSLPNSAVNTRAYNLVRDAITKTKAKGINIKHNELIIDIDCTERFSTYGVNIMKCLTASRGGAGGPYVLSRGRRMTMSELFRFQGMASADFDGWQKADGVSARAMGHMLGNTVSLPIAELVLAQALYASGLVSKIPTGRWCGRGS